MWQKFTVEARRRIKAPRLPPEVVDSGFTVKISPRFLLSPTDLQSRQQPTFTDSLALYTFFRGFWMTTRRDLWNTHDSARWSSLGHVFPSPVHLVWANWHSTAPPYSHLFVISHILGDTWPAPTRVSPLSPPGVWRGETLGTRLCMDLEPCFKVHNLVVIQLNNTKLGQMTNLITWSFTWWCQFINWIKFATRPSPLLYFKVATIHYCGKLIHICF